MMQDLNDLCLFVRVVDQGGFAAAARLLGLPRSRLSRRIGLLEDRLGVRLIQRSTRRFAVTEVGQEYYRHCLAMVVEAEAAQEAIERRRSEPQGIVRVSCPPSLVNYQVGGMIARFMARCPKVDVLLESTNRRVDVIGEGFDLAIRVRFPPLEESDHVMKVFGPSLQLMVAAPGLLAGRVLPQVPADLAAFPSLAWGSPDRTHEWCLEGDGGATALIRHHPRLVTEDMSALRLAALEAVGIGQFPLVVIRDDLAAGRLICLLPGWVPRAGVIHAAFPSRRGLLPSVRALLDFLAAEYAVQSKAETPEAIRQLTGGQATGSVRR